ncbi:MAG: exonuclease domain-containing protein, partial [Gemmatimonadales bacterium]
SRAIFSVARRLIDTNPTLFDKEIEAIRDSEFEVEAYVYPSETVEANWIVRDVQRDREASGLSWGDYAVLYRRHDLGADLESRMVAAGLPCRLAPRRALSDDEIVADVAGALELMMRPGDSAALEKYARIKLDDPDLMQDIVVQGHNSEDFLDVLRNYARRNRKRPEAKKVWRLIYHVENLPALLESHGDLASLVADLTIQSGGKYRNRLETEHDRLSDPLNYPGTDHLAAELEQALAVGRTVWLELGTGLGIALRGLLVQAGVSTTMKYLGEGDVHSGDVVLSRDRAHSGSLAMLVFKALQVMLSRGFDPGPADFVTFDLETTDLFVDRCEIVEIGAARVRGGAVAATYRQLVKPARPIAPNATQEAHGYTDEDVATAPSFAEVWPDFRNFVGDDLVVVHNGHKFDLPVLRRMTEPWGGTESMRFFDTLPLARNLLSQSARLPDLAAHFGIDIGTAHHALDDSLTLVRVYGELNRLKLVRSRKTTATNVLDFLALGLALEDTRRDTEAETLFGIARINALGSYSDCLEF